MVAAVPGHLASQDTQEHCFQPDHPRCLTHWSYGTTHPGQGEPATRAGGKVVARLSSPELALHTHWSSCHLHINKKEDTAGITLEIK